MSDIRDIGLAPSGQDKLDWVASYMPMLAAVRKRFIQEKPFKGLAITISIHLEAKTANLATVLRDGGAEVYVTGCNPLSTQDDVAAALCEQGFEVFARRGVTSGEYTDHLRQALACHPDIIIDDGGDLLELLHGEYREYADRLKGCCEETTTGIHRLRARHAAGKLSYPVISVNDANCKYLFDNRYGTGQSVWDAIMHTTNNLVAAKKVVVAGFGWCGRGIAARAKGMGAQVIVTEVDPVRAIEAAMEGCAVMTMDEASGVGDIFVCATGCKDVIVKRHFERMKDGAILSNAGHFDVEVSKPDLEALSRRVYERKFNVTGYEMADGRTLNLLGEGRLVNLAAGNGHPAEIMDMSFSIQALSLEYFAKNDLKKPGVYAVPEEIDRSVALMKLDVMGIKIDKLTDKQIEYIKGF
ncbi:MAG: adenosylhomocysteinase [Oscillospiraceae bacterium]|jgi:adenosylhomocysteinase|nr:adenosylhomocysteinase [Oscillospiraceae bacterium]